jgi:hypothetical protein
MFFKRSIQGGDQVEQSEQTSEVDMTTTKDSMLEDFKGQVYVPSPRQESPLTLRCSTRSSDNDDVKNNLAARKPAYIFDVVSFSDKLAEPKLSWQELCRIYYSTVAWKCYRPQRRI